MVKGLHSEGTSSIVRPKHFPNFIFLGREIYWVKMDKIGGRLLDEEISSLGETREESWEAGSLDESLFF
jgi:hypothetical protein